MFTCIYDSYNLPEDLFHSYVARLSPKFNSSKSGLVVEVSTQILR